MSIRGDVNDLYRSVLGREGDVSGVDYWTGKIERGESTLDEVRGGMKASTEHQERDKLLQANPHFTEADLDRHVSPGGGLFDQQNIADVMSGGAINMAPIFGPDNTWSGGKTSAETYDALGNIYQQLGIQTAKPRTVWDLNNPTEEQKPYFTPSPTSGTPDSDYITSLYEDKGLRPDDKGINYWLNDLDQGLSEEEVANAFDYSASLNPNSNNYVPPASPAGTPSTPATPPPTGTNQSNWYDGYASGADWLADNPQGGGSSTNSMDDFMKFMMMMSMMGGQGGGGYGGSQYGYGGLTPGGVQPAYNPLEQMQGSWDWFNKAFGSGSSGSGVQGGTTANVQ
tara:strand:- start:260 stop:1279 length:1020 start_codon:yes stop_codon:yes gene_type:complete